MLSATWSKKDLMQTALFEGSTMLMAERCINLSWLSDEAVHKLNI